MMVGSARQTATMVEMVDVGCVSWRTCGHAVACHCRRWMMGLRVGWGTLTNNVWKLENYLLWLGRIDMDIEVVLRSTYVSFATMLEMLQMWSMLVSASWQRCLVDMRWVASTLRIILMHLRHRVVLHVSSCTLLRMAWNMMMDMWMYNVASTSLLTISDLVVHLNASLLIIMSVVVTLLIFIWNHLRLTIIFTLSILARL